MRIFSIIRKGFMSIYTDINGKEHNPIYVVLYTLFLMSIITYIGYHRIVLSNDTISLLISTFSIFTALIFGVIFIAPDKFSQRVESYKGLLKFEDINNYLIRYEHFSRRFVNLLSLVTILSIIILITLTVTHLLNDYAIISIVLSCIAIFLIINFICLLLMLICDIYTMLMDDIENSSNNKSM